MIPTQPESAVTLRAVQSLSEKQAGQLLTDIRLAQLNAQAAFDQHPDQPAVTKPLLRCICALERCRAALGDAVDPTPEAEA